MKNHEKSSETLSQDEKFPHWIWLFAFAGVFDLLAYCILLLINTPFSDWSATLANTAALVLLIGIQGMGFALFGAALIAAAKNHLGKKGLNFKRFAVYNIAGFILLGVLPLIVFLPSRNNSDYGFGLALLPIFIYPFFNLARFFILFFISFLIARAFHPS